MESCLEGLHNLLLFCSQPRVAELGRCQCGHPWELASVEKPGWFPGAVQPALAARQLAAVPLDPCPPVHPRAGDRELENGCSRETLPW